MAKKEVEDKEELKTKNKKKKKIIKIITIVVLSLAVIGFFTMFIIMKQIITPPSKANYKIYNYDGFFIKCETESLEPVEAVKKGETINCYLGFELYNQEQYQVKELYYTLDYGENLKYISSEKSKDQKVYNYKNKYKIVYNNSSGVQVNSGIVYKFEVKETKDFDSIYIKISDIVFKNNSNTYYKAEDKTKNFVSNTDTNYIYVIDNETKVLKYNDVTESVYLKGTYKCQNEDCKYLEASDNYVFFSDDNLVIYNYETNKIIKLNKEYTNYSDYITITNNDDLIGITFKNENDKYGYYSIKKNKLTLQLEYDYIYKYDNQNILEITKNDKYGIYDLEDNKVVVEPKYNYIHCDNLLDKYCIVSNDKNENIYDITTKKLLFKENEFDSISCSGCSKTYELSCKLTKNNKSKLYSPVTNIDKDLSNKEYDNIIIKQKGECDFAYVLKDNNSARLYYDLREPEVNDEYEDIYDIIYDNGETEHILVKENDMIVLKSAGNKSRDIIKIEENYSVDYDETYITYTDENQKTLDIFIRLKGKNSSVITKYYTYKLLTGQLYEN